MPTPTDEALLPPFSGPTRLAPKEPSQQSLVVAFLLLFAVFLLSPNVLPRGDAALSVPTARSLIYDRDLDLSEYLNVPSVVEHYGLVEVGGRQVDYFPWLNSAAAVPVVMIVDTVSIVGATPSTNELIEQDRSWIVHYTSAALWSAGAAIALGLVTGRLWAMSGLRLAAPEGAFSRVFQRWPLLWVCLLIGLSTPLWSITSRSLTAHGPAMVCVSMAIFLVLGRVPPQSSAFLAGLLCACSFWIRPVTLVATVTVAALLLLWSRRSLIPFAICFVTTHLLVLALNQALLDRWLPAYFDGGRLSVHSAYVEALGANLVSPARGLLLFFPPLILVGTLLTPSVRKLIDPTARAAIYVFVGSALIVLLLVSGFGFQWWAGHTYGPRFMTDAMPFFVPVTIVMSGALLLMNAHRLLVRVSVTLVWTLAIFIHWQGGWFHSTQCWNATATVDVDTFPGRVWSLDDPQIISGVQTLAMDGPAAALWTGCEEF